ncbi:Holo-(acyl-carrier-protein) synthase (plasmid) [Deinococcus proteolyticus MRP]|uniref:Holo-[acyl-carrier-protein] synthase n=1 Tax=Deinococcus proteolyticus (strain ATCC 35074 / DSM 20540 / JCM 6276 / NBRC 101906 / NCIMB 13154 / VKM Ac-1939 / CCM 2703 / MRP) TaxID=693977 RepID=F0RPR2_DEIPM|nr:Holo-(acyl-carrier-protein) synthase [Deinococcus proteolyticus MRP]
MARVIVAVGHDLIELERIRGLLRREPQRYRRLFTPAELDYAHAQRDPVPSLAARFAAKEAFQKVWPRPFGWQEVWVERAPTPGGPFERAAPRLHFAPHIAAEMAQRGWRAHLSLTHSREHASAVVVLEQGSPYG